MSSEPLYAEFPDGAKLWGIYHGTSDSILRRLFDTKKDAEKAYFGSRHGFDNLDASEEARQRARLTMEPVKFFTTYGSRTWRHLWNGQASRIERIVVGPYTEPYADEWGNVEDRDLTW